MALRYLAGKMRVPAGAALRRVEGSRAVAYGSSQGRYAKDGLLKDDVPSVTEELKRLYDHDAALIRQIRMGSSYSRSYNTQLALYFSGGTILGLCIVSLLLRYENRSGGKIGKMMCGIPTK